MHGLLPFCKIDLDSISSFLSYARTIALLTIWSTVLGLAITPLFGDISLIRAML